MLKVGYIGLGLMGKSIARNILNAGFPVVVHNRSRAAVDELVAEGAIAAGKQSSLALGNLDARRDWGFAGDYVEAMWRMLQHHTADDYVVATGESHSVREFVEAAFGHAGLEWERYVRLDPRYLRPSEVDHLLGDPSKARRELGWTPTVTFQDLVRRMVDADRAALG